MAKYRKSSHALYCCQHLVVWTPKYRYRILEGKTEEFLRQRIEQISGWHNVEVEELKSMPDHIRLLCSIPPRLSVSEYMGY